MKIILEVEQDELALPVNIFYSYQEAADSTGCKVSYIQNICYNKTILKPRFVKVNIEEEGE